MAGQLLRIEEVSEKTGVPVETLRWWRKRDKGEGPRSGKLGRRVVYYASDVEAWIRSSLGAEEHPDLAPAPPTQLRAI
ncbi:helix-turn-helix domain-containing protein [Nocardioides sp. BP30]|uniref:helix-turn-helix transcriptional regulator n=1 Tax=Nocardioides sp. BP30 TaxID=3036374 RepID=UPI0024690BA6|nr:helix-turn-helix domain-containing protein [Nocardioides sp. BP30]WGL50674.1 helix-turn-helix domain-containing protein [Nocardioides sp. BP30]